MSTTTVLSDAVITTATDSQSVAAVVNPNADLMTEVKSVDCECCGLTEECTPAYMERIRERYKGKWICGLCGEAVKDEIVRSERLISTEEAMMRHLSFRKASRSPPNPAVHLIAAMRQILKRSLDSPRSMRSVPCSPTTRSVSVGIARSESCIPTLTLAVESLDSSTCDEFEEANENE